MAPQAEAARSAHKTDRRIVRTRTAIRKAFTELVGETDYDKITVTALARRADIDRKTFYTHYASIDDLFEDVIRNRLEESVASAKIGDFLADPRRCTKELLVAFHSAVGNQIEHQRAMFEHLPAEKLLRCWTSVAKERLNRQLGPLPTEAQGLSEIALDYYLGGIFNAYTCWLTDDRGISLAMLLLVLGDSVSNGLSAVSMAIRNANAVAGHAKPAQ